MKCFDQMELFRISAEKYSGELSASGRPNRWNIRGSYVIYASASRSLATLELVVHRSSILPGIRYNVMVISVADDDRLVKQLVIKELPDEWRRLAGYSRLQEIGMKWYEEQQSLLLKVPSVLIPNEYNYVINTEHPDFKTNVRLIRQEEFFWDDRLIK